MNKSRLTEIIESQVSTFLNNIAREMEKPHADLFDGFGFPVFGESSREYHEQVYFQSYLESYTRKLINSILQEIFEEELWDEIVWPEFEYNGIYSGYTNAECEQEFGFEFINKDKKIGYRYTSFKNDEIGALLSQGKVENIELVIWESRDYSPSFHYGDSRVRVVNVFELFQELFVELSEQEIIDMYDIFEKKLNKAVAQANSMISLTTIPGFTTSYLNKMKCENICTLQKEIDLLTYFTVNTEKYKYVEEQSKQLIELYKLAQYFQKKGMERALFGTSDYAKSFMTSEYLYHYFTDNPMFDYTPIVSGYLKSIEQLLYSLCSGYDSMNDINEDISNDMLSNYIQGISNGKYKIFRREILPVKRTIINCLLTYKNESRNNLFHKDYFNKWDKVEQIRRNTIFLYVILLGALDPDISYSNPSILGIINDEYDRLFSVIDSCDNVEYSFTINGVRYNEMNKNPRYIGLTYDENGSIKNNIVFSKFVYDHNEKIEISRLNMPSEVWITDNSGPRKIWPLRKI